jgi:flagellar basal body-associated protein FliL
MTRLPSWGHELEAHQRRQRRRETIKTVLIAIATVLGACAVLVIAWLFAVGFLVTFG